MLSSFCKSAAASLLLLSTVVSAQEGVYLDGDQIRQAWINTLASPVAEGNGAFMAPDGSSVVVADFDCGLSAFEPETGERQWYFKPVASPLTCTAGVFFNYNATTPFIAYAVTTGGQTTLQKVSPNGSPLYTTGPLFGLPAGTPVTTADGRYLLVTVNPTLGTGLFAVFDSEQPPNSPPTFSFPTEESRFSAIGAYWNPEQGYFAGGYDNSNDVFMWSLATDLNPVTNVDGTVGPGQMYAFQLPVDPSDPLTIITVGDARTFRSILAPLLSNDGFNLYWSVTRSEFNCWAGAENLVDFGFDTEPLRSADFPLGDPESASARAPPVVSTGTLTGVRMVYGPTAANQIFRFRGDCSEDTNDIYSFDDSTTVLYNKVLLSDADVFAYVGTPKGDLHAFNALNLANGPTWTFAVGGNIRGEMARSPDGTYIYTADVNGRVRAIQVRETIGSPPPTQAPTPAPTRAPTDFGLTTRMPIPMPSRMPSTLPSLDPSAPGETDMPTIPMPSLMPSTMPSLDPSAPGETDMPTVFASEEPSFRSQTDMPMVAPSGLPSFSPAPSQKALTEEPTASMMPVNAGLVTRPPSDLTTVGAAPGSGCFAAMTTLWTLVAVVALVLV